MSILSSPFDKETVQARLYHMTSKAINLFHNEIESHMERGSSPGQLRDISVHFMFDFPMAEKTTGEMRSLESAERIYPITTSYIVHTDSSVYTFEVYTKILVQKNIGNEIVIGELRVTYTYTIEDGVITRTKTAGAYRTTASDIFYEITGKVAALTGQNSRELISWIYKETTSIMIRLGIGAKNYPQKEKMVIDFKRTKH